MSHRHSNWAIETVCDSGNEKAILMLLANYAGSDGTCYPGQETLARQACCSVKTVERALKVFEDRGWIERAQRRRRDGSRTSDLIRFCDVLAVEQYENAQPDTMSDRTEPTRHPVQTNPTPCPNQPDTMSGLTTFEPPVEPSGEKRARDPVTRDKAIDISQEDLDRIWNAYPDDGKVSSAPGNLVFWLRDALVTLGSVSAVLAAVVAYARACRKHDSRPKAIHNFLTDRPLLLRYAPPPDAPEPGEAARWDALCEVYARREDWEGEGPPPGHPGCRVPDDIQRRYGFEPSGPAAEGGEA